MKQELAQVARRAIEELGLPCEVDSVLNVLGRAEWRIKFTPGYGQLTDGFHDKNGKRYSTHEIMEIIKQHLLCREEIRSRQSER